MAARNNCPFTPQWEVITNKDGGHINVVSLREDITCKVGTIAIMRMSDFGVWSWFYMNLFEDTGYLIQCDSRKWALLVVICTGKVCNVKQNKQNQVLNIFIHDLNHDLNHSFKSSKNPVYGCLKGLA